MNMLNMEYNSGRDGLVIPEYGRNVQKLIDHAKQLEDPKERQAFVESVITLMMQMHPQNRNLDDYRAKLWKHVVRIARYDLDVDIPEGVDVDPENVRLRPDKLTYPERAPRFLHYGRNVQTLVKKALAMEEGPKRDGFVQVIGSYMKLAYKTWNREHYVSDEIIKEDLAALSNGKLTLNDDLSIDNLSNANRGRRNKSGNSNTHKSSRRNHNDRNNRRRSRN